MNKLIVITAPSGAGKTTITHHLIKHFRGRLRFSVSAATRAPTGQEKEGVDYYFMHAETFQKLIRENAFLEWEMVYEGKYYGTLRSEVTRIWAEGGTPLLDIDVKGALHVKDQYPEQSLTLFIEPPSMEELRRRLIQRGTETEASLAARISKSEYELSFKNQFDHIILNDDLDKACKEAVAIIAAFLGD